MSSVQSETRSSPADLEGEYASRFRVIGYVVQAVKRFKAALNPGITFGKRSASPEELEVVGERVMSVPARQMSTWVSGRLSEPAEQFRKVGSRKLTSYLLQPLPAVK